VVDEVSEEVDLLYMTALPGKVSLGGSVAYRYKVSAGKTFAMMKYPPEEFNMVDHPGGMYNSPPSLLDSPLMIKSLLYYDTLIN